MHCVLLIVKWEVTSFLKTDAGHSEMLSQSLGVMVWNPPGPRARLKQKTFINLYSNCRVIWHQENRVEDFRLGQYSSMLNKCLILFPTVHDFETP